MPDQLSMLADEPEAAVDRFEAILFGRDATDRIVAIEPMESRLRLWRRLADDSFVVQDEEFRVLLRVLVAFGFEHGNTRTQALDLPLEFGGVGAR